MSFYRTDNPVKDAERYAAEQEEALKKLPVCCCCGDEGYIDDDYYYLIEDEIYCYDHMVKNFRRSVDDYVE